jgi:hypothetical protein
MCISASAHAAEDLRQYLLVRFPPATAADRLPSRRRLPPPVLVAMTAVPCHAACHYAFGRDWERQLWVVLCIQGDRARPSEQSRGVGWPFGLYGMDLPWWKHVLAPARSENEYISYFCIEFWVFIRIQVNTPAAATGMPTYTPLPLLPISKQSYCCPHNKQLSYHCSSWSTEYDN